MSHQESLRLVVGALLLVLLASACAGPQPTATPLPTATYSPMPTATSTFAPTATSTLAPPTITPTSVLPTNTPMPVPTTFESQIRPVDANRDGVIDQKDVLLLIARANELWDKSIKPLLDKAGIQTDEKGNVITPDPQAKIRERLTSAEQSDLDEALNEYRSLSVQVTATLNEALRKK